MRHRMTLAQSCIERPHLTFGPQVSRNTPGFRPVRNIEQPPRAVGDTDAVDASLPRDCDPGSDKAKPMYSTCRALRSTVPPADARRVRVLSRRRRLPAHGLPVRGLNVLEVVCCSCIIHLVHSSVEDHQRVSATSRPTYAMPSRASHPSNSRHEGPQQLSRGLCQENQST